MTITWTLVTSGKDSTFSLPSVSTPKIAKPAVAISTSARRWTAKSIRRSSMGGDRDQTLNATSRRSKLGSDHDFLRDSEAEVQDGILAAWAPSSPLWRAGRP